MPVNKGLFHRTEHEETGQRVAVAAANVVLLLSVEGDPDGAVRHKPHLKLDPRSGVIHSGLL